ncbi:MAG: hypothetical protein WKG07_48815 [Hymenobacter sp.]
MTASSGYYFQLLRADEPLRTAIGPSHCAAAGRVHPRGRPAGRSRVADFQGRPRPGQTHAALTSANINTGATCRDDVFSGHRAGQLHPNRVVGARPGHA